jgi:hypothetical protein
LKTELTIRNCSTVFRLQCPRLWNELTETAVAEIRHCEVCQQDVYFCFTDSETIEHAKAGHCIAREMPDRTELPRVFVGRPKYPIETTPSQQAASETAQRERGIDDAIRNARDANRCCSECGYPAPDWRVKCRICGFEFGRNM